MGVRLSIAIQAHPLRRELANVLAAALPEAEVVWDPDPNGQRSAWRCYRACLGQTDDFATHRLILQDDVVVCDGFLAAVRAALDARPDDLISFFVAGQPREYAFAVRQAAAQGHVWAELGWSRWCPVVALCWPVRHIRPCLEWVDAQHWPAAFRADDEIVGRWHRHAEVPLVATVPSLVEHPDDVPSLLGLRARGGGDDGRIAACYIGGCDPAEIDWRIPA